MNTKIIGLARRVDSSHRYLHLHNVNWRAVPRTAWLTSSNYPKGFSLVFMRSWYLRIVRLGGVEVFLPFKGFIQIGLNLTHHVSNHASINGYYLSHRRTSIIRHRYPSWTFSCFDWIRHEPSALNKHPFNLTMDVTLRLPIRSFHYKLFQSP